MKFSFQELRRIILQEIKQTLNNNKIAYYGSTQKIQEFDIRKTKEFGIHFALNSPDSSFHRIKNSGGFLYEVSINYNKPLILPDVLRWTLESVLAELKFSIEYIKKKKLEASKKARQNGTSLREEENVILSEILDDLNFDSILYENRGEAGGKAIIIWHPEQIEILKCTRISKNG